MFWFNFTCQLLTLDKCYKKKLHFNGWRKVFDAELHLDEINNDSKFDIKPLLWLTSQCSRWTCKLNIIFYKSIISRIQLDNHCLITLTVVLWVMQSNHSPLTSIISSPGINIPFIKGTNGRQKIYEIFHVYCIFLSGFKVSKYCKFWNNERWKSCFKYFSIMKLFHLQKPLLKWR